MRTISYWVLVLAVLVGGANWVIGPVSAIYSPGAMLLVLGPTLAFLLAKLGLQATFAFLSRLVKNEVNEQDHKVIDLVNSVSFLFGGLGVVMGLIRVLRNLATPDGIGPGMAVCVMCLMYGAIPAILLLPFNDSIGARKLVRVAAAYAFVAAPAFVGATMLILKLANVV